MEQYLNRFLEQSIKEGLENSPVVAVLGPRQCGKSTLVRHLLRTFQPHLFLDLELPIDLAKLDDPQSFFEANANSLICIDEVQRKPDLFPIIRAISDYQGRNGQYLVTGSASPDLLRQSSESLAGRIHLNELSPFMWGEINEHTNLSKYLVEGGFPRSILSKTERNSLKWRQDFITTFLERDIFQFGLNISSQTVKRLWTMVAHYHGQVLNHNSFAQSLGVSNPTVKKYLDILSGAFMIRFLQPYLPNLKKRLIKSPKLYIRDHGILTALLYIENYNDLLGHPIYGPLWEGVVVENLIFEFPGLEYYYYRTSNKAEIDFIIKKGNKIIAVECKASKQPKPSRGLYHCISDINPDATLVVAPIDSSWPARDNVEVHNLDSAVKRIAEVFSC